MRSLTNIALAALATLSAACGGGAGQKELQFAAPQAPTLEEQAAGAEAQASLEGSLTFSPSTEPSAGAPGLADQLVSSLGGYAAPTAALDAQPATQARRVLGRTAAMAAVGTGLDPACVTTTETSVTWRGCVITLSETDPISGDTTDSTVRINGRLGWTQATGVTTWSIDEVMTMTMTSAGESMRVDATMGQDGTITVSAAAIKGHTSSAISVAMSYQGQSASEAVATTLDLDLGYQAAPFCVTGGTLTLQQRWSRRPPGATAADLPDQGWRFEWTGCGLFTVAHGT